MILLAVAITVAYCAGLARARAAVRATLREQLGEGPWGITAEAMGDGTLDFRIVFRDPINVGGCMIRFEAHGRVRAAQLQQLVAVVDRELHAGDKAGGA